MADTGPDTTDAFIAKWQGVTASEQPWAKDTVDQA